MQQQFGWRGTVWQRLAGVAPVVWHFLASHLREQWDALQLHFKWQKILRPCSYRKQFSLLSIFIFPALRKRFKSSSLICEFEPSLHNCFDIFLISQHVLGSEYLLMGSIKPKVNIKCCWCQSRSNLGGVWSDIEIKDWVKILTHHLLSFQISLLGRGPIKSLITRWRNRISWPKIPSKTTPTTLIQCRVFWDRKVGQTFGAAGKLSLLEVSDFQVFCSQVSTLTTLQKEEKAAHV